ncbi:MAG TPA: benenodin family lasso peptide [Allosphingosinicella sp.]|nr:benenodin family lasso peptide [Allosphingosinicella sp.]
MERNSPQQDDVVDLGQATVETKGAVGRPFDEALGIPGMGLTDD